MEPTTKMIFWVLLGGCRAFPSLHELMTLEERMAIFQTNELPEYELIPITVSKVHKRSAAVDNRKTISMRAFGENITLSCVENDGILAGKETPIYNVRNEGETIFIRNSQKTGVIRSRRLAIHSLPERIADKIMKHRRSLDNIGDDEAGGYQYHLVTKIPESSIVMYNYNDRPKRRAHEIPQTIFPEVLVIVNYWLYKIFLDQWVPYVLSFWHAVDLMYRNVFAPEIRLNIAGIVIAETEYALSYIYKNEVAGRDDDYRLDTIHSLQGMGEWLYIYRKNISLRSYDVAFTMTSNKLCGLTCDRSQINGLAYLKGACRRMITQKMTPKVAIIQNKGAFDKITSAAHELGHLIGAEHDETNPKCDPSTFMMSQFGGDRNSSKWSNCTLTALDEYLISRAARCLHNKPNPGQILPAVLPGTIMNADEQCQKLGFNEHCPTAKGICVQLGCRKTIPSKRKCKRTKTAAATGTICGEGKVCFQLQCVDKNHLETIGIV